MKRKITLAQRRALLWLAQHDGEQSMRRAMIEGNIAARTIHNLAYDRLISARYAQVWGSGKRPIESVRLTDAGRTAVSAECPHDWRQVELDAQECRLCGATRLAFGSGYESYLG